MSAACKAPRLPTLVVFVAVACACVSIWQTVRLAGENATLRSFLVEPSGSTHPASSRASSKRAGDGEITEAQLESARVRLRHAEAQAEKLAAELAIAPAEELQTLGRIEELATDAVKLVKVMDEISQIIQAGESAGGKTNGLTNDVPQWLVHTEAIGQLEAEPADIADLHARALRELLGLDESAVHKVRERLAAEFELLRAHRLDRPHRPAEEQDDWYARRDRMLLEAAARIEALIPARHRKPNAVAKIMNLGSSFRFRAQQAPDGGVRRLDLFYQEPGSKPIRL
jgi:hypothetical protein